MSIMVFPAPGTPLFIDSMSGRFTPATSVNALGGFGTITSNAWPSNNLAYYVPLALPFHYPVKRV